MDSKQKMADNFLPDEEYNYCIHCEKPAKRDDWLVAAKCPYICDGSPLDSWSWEMIRKYNNYPKVPEMNRKYPVYPNQK